MDKIRRVLICVDKYCFYFFYNNCLIKCVKFILFDFLIFCIDFGDILIFICYRDELFYVFVKYIFMN